MRGGKSIGLIAITLLVAGLLEPSWQWFVGRFLDTASTDPHGLRGAIERVGAMFSPVQQILFGAAGGMMIALVIGYWRQITVFTKSVPSRMVMSFVFLSNLFHRETVLVKGKMVLAQDEMEKEIVVPARVYEKLTQIRTPHYSNVYANRTYGGKIAFRRTDRLPKKIWYEIWG
jgi:hypothetical protein